MSEFDSTSATSNTECQEVMSAFISFLQNLNENEWLSQSSKEEIKSCLHSARNIEKILDGLKTNGSLEAFVNLLPNLYGYNVDQICNACDITLRMVLTASGVPLPCVRTCIDEYLKLCGSERFENVLASVIFSSEIYRVLLDFIATTDNDFESHQINLQSHLFRNLWKTETHTQNLTDKFYKWLKTDLSGKNIAVSLQVVYSEDGRSHVSFSLVSALVKVLQERGDTAALFWRIFTLYPNGRKAMFKSNKLLNSLLDFFITSSKWMETTDSFSWTSKEQGPCKVFGFEELLKALNNLVELGGSVSERVDHFLSERRNSAGCTFWDDVEMRLTR